MWWRNIDTHSHLPSPSLIPWTRHILTKFPRKPGDLLYVSHHSVHRQTLFYFYDVMPVWLFVWLWNEDVLVNAYKLGNPGCLLLQSRSKRLGNFVFYALIPYPPGNIMVLSVKKHGPDNLRSSKPGCFPIGSLWVFEVLLLAYLQNDAFLVYFHWLGLCAHFTA